MNRLLRLYIVSIVFGCASCMHGMNMNLLVPYNPLIRPYAADDQQGQFFFMLEAGLGHAIAFNQCDKTNALQIFDAKQNAIRMLEGFAPGTAPATLLANIDPYASGFNADRGVFKVTGDLSLDVGGGITFRYFFGCGWSINAYLPFYSMRLKNVCWQNLTQNLTPDDQRVHTLLTDDFAANMLYLGKGLSIGPWQRAGFGDLAVLLDWHQDFPQEKPILNNVALNARAGLSAPTSLRSDPDLIMALPFGMDGAWSLPFAMDIELTLACYGLLGLDVQLIHTFGHTHIQRIPNLLAQTSLLYLQKACIYQDFGWNQQFSLYGGIKELPKGFLASIGYQYIKQGNTQLFPVSNDVSTTLVQEAAVLQDWTVHQFIIRADYDCAQWLQESPISTRVGLFAQIPFNGKRSILFTTLGASVTLDF